jgi:uncharacterized protein YprB with RNaseH-like and TPR domain
MPPRVEAYLDIETTGLSPSEHYITVVGIYAIRGTYDQLVQLVGDEVTADNLTRALRGVDTIYTYNGSRFDLPFIQISLGVELVRYFKHCDLMYNCWQKNLFGGLKAVERQLRIDRKLKGVSGYDAIWLWWRYQNHNDEMALKKLLEYNREDLVNLKSLRDIIG